MQSSDSFVLSTGGGTPCYANNHLLLNGDGSSLILSKSKYTNLI